MVSYKFICYVLSAATMLPILYIESLSSHILTVVLFAQFFAVGFIWLKNLTLTTKEFMSRVLFTPAVIAHVFFVIWYLTMMIPVNVENKLTLLEVLFYHSLLTLDIFLLRRLKNTEFCRVPLPRNAPDLSRSQGLFQINLSVHGSTCYCPWLDLHINAACWGEFSIFLLVHLVYAFYTANLALTSICTPSMYLDRFVFPVDCSSVFADWGRAWVYAVSWHWLLGNCMLACESGYHLYVLIDQATASHILSSSPSIL